mmetsp:Transcript_91382/g.255252  ORF Transcript_91382/g.255252 Transcript_91382/m.255252 type:complete len:456 (+) Transcript_91382:749-2116(+)
MDHAGAHHVLAIGYNAGWKALRERCVRWPLLHVAHRRRRVGGRLAHHDRRRVGRPLVEHVPHREAGVLPGRVERGGRGRHVRVRLPRRAPHQDLPGRHAAHALRGRRHVGEVDRHRLRRADHRHGHPGGPHRGGPAQRRVRGDHRRARDICHHPLGHRRRTGLRLLRLLRRLLVLLILLVLLVLLRRWLRRLRRRLLLLRRLVRIRRLRHAAPLLRDGILREGHDAAGRHALRDGQAQLLAVGGGVLQLRAGHCALGDDHGDLHRLLDLLGLLLLVHLLLVHRRLRHAICLLRLPVRRRRLLRIGGRRRGGVRRRCGVARGGHGVAVLHHVPVLGLHLVLDHHVWSAVPVVVHRAGMCGVRARLGRHAGLDDLRGRLRVLRRLHGAGGPVDRARRRRRVGGPLHLVVRVLPLRRVHAAALPRPTGCRLAPVQRRPRPRPRGRLPPLGPGRNARCT